MILGGCWHKQLLLWIIEFSKYWDISTGNTETVIKKNKKNKAIKKKHVYSTLWKLRVWRCHFSCQTFLRISHPFGHSSVALFWFRSQFPTELGCLSVSEMSEFEHALSHREDCWIWDRVLQNPHFPACLKLKAWKHLMSQCGSLYMIISKRPCVG